ERQAETIRLPKLIAAEGLAPSVTEAQRLISQGSVRVNGEKVTDVKKDIVGEAGKEILLQVGKLKFLRAVFK
ncbi:MAG TPA: S4 domain-containing protein, partial [Blastocatellia bacterium]